MNLRRIAVTSVAVLVGAMVAAGPAKSAAPGTRYSGQATVVHATVLGLEPVVLADTGPLPGEGGAREASLLTANVPGLLTATVLHASTVGQGEHARSEASVAELNMTVGGNDIEADFLMARAAAVCNGAKPSVSGSSDIVALDINGERVAVSGQPNQTVNLPGGRVVINEQTSTADSITVNALHVTIDGVANVIIASAHADIACAKPVCPGGDFMTGGGRLPPKGTAATFGVAGGLKNGSLWGHLTFIDHGTGMRVKGLGVTAYTVTGPTTRHVEGAAEVDGMPATYAVDLTDNGEPGRQDFFDLRLSTGYARSGLLDGGNLQLHRCR